MAVDFNIELYSFESDILDSEIFQNSSFTLNSYRASVYLNGCCSALQFFVKAYHLRDDFLILDIVYQLGMRGCFEIENYDSESQCIPNHDEFIEKSYDNNIIVLTKDDKIVTSINLTPQNSSLIGVNQISFEKISTSLRRNEYYQALSAWDLGPLECFGVKLDADTKSLGRAIKYLTDKTRPYCISNLENLNKFIRCKEQDKILFLDQSNKLSAYNLLDIIGKNTIYGFDHLNDRVTKRFYRIN